MVGTTDKTSGFANEVMGKIKQGIGSVAGSEKLKEEGAVQEQKGRGQKIFGDAGDDVDRSAPGFNREGQIRERAYSIWEQQGCPDGREHDHWGQAEREILAEQAGQNL